MSFQERLQKLDISLFDIPSASSAADKTAFLMAQCLIRRLHPDFTYLEIGSEKGGSILPYLLDPACQRIISIDPRPAAMNDERGTSFAYPEDGEAQMLARLSAYAPIDRVIPIRSDIRDASPENLPKAQIALIDGEHTNIACFSDANRVLDFVDEDCIILFHDANLIADAIQNYRLLLNRLNRPHSFVIVPDCVALVGLGKYRKPLLEAYSSVSLDVREFFRRSQIKRWNMICDSILQNNGLPRPEEIHLILQQRNALIDENDRLSNEVESLRSHIIDYKNSLSWKLTTPLRFLSRLIRGEKNE